MGAVDTEADGLHFHETLAGDGDTGERTALIRCTAAAFDRANVVDGGGVLEDRRGKKRSSRCYSSYLWLPAATRSAGWRAPHRMWGGGRWQQRLQRRNVARGVLAGGSPH